MPRALSIDLRERLVGEVEAGSSVRAVGRLFGVSPSTVSNISRLKLETGDLAPRPMGGDRRSHVLETHGERILALVAETPDLTLDELRAILGADGIAAGRVSIWRLLKRHGLSFKKRQRTPPSRSAPT